MGIKQSPRSLHWDYYLTIEEDLKNLARYVEIDLKNFEIFSIELARILQITSSEIDVVLKLLCSKLNPTKCFENITDYKNEIKNSWPDMIEEKVYSSRYGLELTPWINWNINGTPDWWRSYNNVKHERNIYYHEANLKNVLNAVAALLICTSYYYLICFTDNKNKAKLKDTFLKLGTNSDFFNLNNDHYYSNLIVS
jgi:hypothetical protein